MPRLITDIESMHISFVKRKRWSTSRFVSIRVNRLLRRFRFFVHLLIMFFDRRVGVFFRDKIFLGV
ncbi:hypothetical protein C497_06844 [Halalkalicoccus jeotgali B3]|uniref:Uncharacterized protein n=1 Tax=Halalkalicoccus jeotgali (strain DSM 18796 / CECT 7217 / JCM 14584 / KCTC 4019 / B3) TaxID=795797 RepID=D8JC19_HALJB|nr:hypothetical protein HacjB3_17918 [Halalkalicoccus jeotgali B3]ELY38637.1 hypothetical protein C497_06844 [Halalkalicoccus jeotgali B3]